MPSAILPSFAKGQLDTSLHGRVDTAAYQVGLAKARNMIIHSAGGCSNRSGLLFIGPCKTHTAAGSPRLIEFQFKTTDQYILEFGDTYMRVIRNGAHVIESTKTISAATAANPVVVTATSHGYLNGDEVFIDGVVGMTEINSQRFIVANKTTNTFQLTHQVTGANINGSAFTAYSSAGTAARVFTLTTPYAIADIPNLKFVQSADVMTLVHPDYDPQELSRVDHDDWTISDIAFVPTIIHPTGVGITVDGADNSITYKYFVTAVDKDTGEESLPGLTSVTKTISGITAANPAVVTTSTSHTLEPGDTIRITSVVGMTEVNNRHFTVGATASGTTFELQNENSTNYTAYSSAGTMTEAFAVTAVGTTVVDNTIAWTGSTNATRYNVYRRRNAEPLGFVGETTGLTFKDDNITEDVTAPPPVPRNPFVGRDNRPGAVSYYQQRRVFAATNDAPDTSYYSQTAGHNNFTVKFPVLADDSITVTFNARKVNTVRHFAPGNDLLVFTSGGEWRVNSGDNSGFSAATISSRPQTYWGISEIEPVIAGDAVLFITQSGAQVRSMDFEAKRNSYGGVNLSELASDLFEEYVATDWAYARQPEGRAHIIRADGQVMTMTYNPFQEVVAWTTWDTDGDFESAAALENTASATEDGIYFVVKRTINGNDVRYIERTQSRVFSDVKDCKFMDSMLSLDSPLTITAITSANPPVVTSAAHGLVNDDQITLDDIVWANDVSSTFEETQPAQLNGGRYTVKNKTTNTFEVFSTASTPVAINGSAFNAYVKGGAARLLTTSLTGLRHLEGEAVVVLADGNVVTNLTVSGTGTLTLPSSSSRVHVGLRYISDLETLNIERDDSTIQGLTKKISEVVIRLNKSRGMLIGPTSTKLIEWKQREFEKIGEPTALLTGDATVTILPDWNSQGRIFIRQKDPLPMTVLAIMPSMTISSS